MEPATATKAVQGPGPPTAEIRSTAARLGALLGHIFRFGQGDHLRMVEESGLTMTQCKALLALAPPGKSPEPRQISEIADGLGISLPAASRAVDGMFKKRLITRVEDEEDRRVRRIAITSRGEKLAGDLVSMRLAALEDFASSLTAAQRRKLDAAVDALLDREEVATAYEALLKEGRSR